MTDWIDNFRPVWQRTIRSKSTQDRAETLPPTSWAYVMLFSIFLKRQKLFLHQLNSKNNGSVLWFKTILWYWYCFTLSVAIHWNLGQQDTWHTSTRWVYDWFRYVRCGRWRLWSSLQHDMYVQVGKISTWFLHLYLWGRCHLMVTRLNLFFFLVLTATII